MMRDKSRSIVSPTEHTMTWTTPVVTEICAGLEVTAYLTAEI